MARAKALPLTVVVAALVSTLLAGAVRSTERETSLGELTLRDPCICRAPGGTYYLTGTTNINTLEPRHADWQNNDGVRLWRSKDLKTWREVGLVWNLATDPPESGARGGKMWQRYLRAVPGHPEMPWSHGVTAPEIHYLRGTFWTAFAMNDQDVGLLRSTTGEAEGPYEEHCRLDNSHLGGDLSLFVDRDLFADTPDDKVDVYAVWGAGYVAKLKDDLSAVDERPTVLQAAIEGFPQEEAAPQQTGERGAFLFRHEGNYYFVYAAWNRRDGEPHFDTLACRAEHIYGPYSKPRVMIPDGGQATVFDGPEGCLAASCSIEERPALFVLRIEEETGLPVAIRRIR